MKYYDPREKDIIIIIDQQRTFRNHFSVLLRMNGFRVIAFSELDEARLYLMGNKVKAILLDADFPLGYSDYLFDRFREEFGCKTFLICSEECKADGEYKLCKPISVNDIIKKL